MRDTIDYGIDLGTTNSAIAVAAHGTAKIVRGPGSVETIPSAVNITPNGSIRVGQRAADLVVEDADNAYDEFKLKMGQHDARVQFKDSGRSMSPEELSAQVLQALRTHVESASIPGQEPAVVDTAVITVPAAFTSDQTAATKRAAELAGLTSPTLLQEPTAAAWAFLHDLENPPKRGFWMVYDFGGGTFDAAIVKLYDGEFSVVAHAGNNALGGKRIDWTLVEDCLLPALDVPPGTPDILTDKKLTGPKAKLKKLAEQAKVELSAVATAEIDDAIEIGEHRIRLVHTVTRADLDKAALPLVESTIELCREALKRAGLQPKDIERVVLVGGSSRLRLAQEMLGDPETGLGIPLDDSQDPMTVVARGAALYAGRQPLPAEVMNKRPVAEDTVMLRLDYPRAGLDDDPLLGGAAELAQTTDWTGWTISAANTTSPSRGWSTGEVPLKASGKFSTRLKAFEHGPTEFDLTLRRPDGTVAAVSQKTLTYNYTDRPHGSDTARTPYDTGLGLSDNSLCVLIPRNVPVPRNGSAMGLRTSQPIDKRAGTGQVVIPIFQGDHARADRNDMVGRLIIGPDDVRRDVPAGVEVEVSLHMDASFTFSQADAYVDYLGESFEITIDTNSPPAPTVAELEAKHNDLIDRLNALKTSADEINAIDAEAQIARLETGGPLAEVERELAHARMDPDAARTCDRCIRNAESVLDGVEKELEIPGLIHDLRHWLNVAKEVIAVYGGADERRRLAKLEPEAESAISLRDESVLKRRTDEAMSLAVNTIPQHMLGEPGSDPLPPAAPKNDARDGWLEGPR